MVTVTLGETRVTEDQARVRSQQHRRAARPSLEQPCFMG